VIVAGVDPGSHRTGWGVVQIEGNLLTALGAGVIQPNSEAPLHERVEPIFRGLLEILKQHQPEVVFVESVFHARNARAALVLGHARGVALLAIRMADKSVRELAPAEVKKAVTGNGRAEKSQVQAMVKIILGLGERLPYDASDALAIAVAGAQRARSPLAALLASAPKPKRLPRAFRP
jgi:crossover junction endodeoxyribonuclease RuvC